MVEQIDLTIIKKFSAAESLVDQFLDNPGTVFDVRSPCEYAKGHIPGAYNLPLFSDIERTEVGICYKQRGQEAAVELGLHLVQPKLDRFVAYVKEHFLEKCAKVHCFRGGLRSQSVTWLLKNSGIETTALKGGYKAYRRFVLNALKKKYFFIVIGGMTGSGKSAILSHLKATGEQVLDLENLANHRGSSFGHIGMLSQPSNEQFENEIVSVLTSADPSKPIWVEDESRMIGRCKIPDCLFKLIQESPLLLVECPLEERLERLFKEYGTIEPQILISSVRALFRRLGRSRAEEIIALIEEDRRKEAIEKVLPYYDSSYRYSLTKKGRSYKTFKFNNLSLQEQAESLKKQ